MITSAQMSAIINLTIEGFHEVKSSYRPKQDKWVVCEERLRVIKGFVVYDPDRVAEICLVPNVVVSKKFKVTEFFKYTVLECLKTHLRLYYNKMIEVIHNKKLPIHFFQNSLTGSVLS